MVRSNRNTLLVIQKNTMRFFFEKNPKCKIMASFVNIRVQVIVTGIQTKMWDTNIKKGLSVPFTLSNFTVKRNFLFTMH